MRGICGAIGCIISLTLANFFAEWMHANPEYENAFFASWNQMVAILIYHFIFVRSEQKNAMLQ